MIVDGSLAQAQTGKISGSIFDVEANDVMPFANVSLKGTNTGTTSDFEGDYSLTVEPGTYTVVFSYRTSFTTLSASSDTNAWCVEGEELIRHRAKAAFRAHYEQRPPMTAGEGER